MFGKRTNWTEETVNERLRNDKRDIVCDKYGGASNKQSEFRCTVSDCGHRWNAAWRDVLGSNCRTGTGCPSCSGLVPWTKETVNDRLRTDKRNIVCAKYGGSARKQSEFRCTVSDCGHTWHTGWHAVLGGNGRTGSGCPSCSGNVPWTKEKVNERLRNDKRDIVCAKYGGSIRKQSEFWCTVSDCGHTWHTNWGNVLGNNCRTGTGCPNCASNSKGENVIKAYLDSNSIKYTPQWSPRWIGQKKVRFLHSRS